MASAPGAKSDPMRNARTAVRLVVMSLIPDRRCPDLHPLALDEHDHVALCELVRRARHAGTDGDPRRHIRFHLAVAGMVLVELVAIRQYLAPRTNARTDVEHLANTAVKNNELHPPPA